MIIPRGETLGEHSKIINTRKIMKKISFYALLGMFGLCAASCNDDYTDWASPANHPQEEAVTIKDFKAEAKNSTLDLGAAGVADSVQLFTLTTGTYPDGSTLENVRVLLTASDVTGAKPVTLQSALNGKVNTDTLNAKVTDAYGKKAEPRNFSAEVLLNVTLNGQAMLVNAGKFNLQITPIPPKYADYYYLIGKLNDWNLPGDVKTLSTLMYPVGEGVWSYTTKWVSDHNLKVLPYTGSFLTWDDAFGTAKDGDNSATGTVGGSGAIASPTAEEFYTFTLDMSTNTYKWTKLDNQSPAEYKSIGICGQVTNWADNADIVMTQVTPHNWYVSTTLSASGELKFRADGAWTDSWGVKVTLSKESYSGVANYNGENITVPAGTYDVYFNDITGQFAFVAK